MKKLTIILLFFASVSQGQTGAGFWHGSQETGAAPAGPDTIDMPYFSDLLLYHCADRGITEDANGVSQWDDLSGNGNHSTQTVNTNKPTTDANGNIVFDGTDDYLSFSDPFSSVDSAFTIFVVFEYTGSTSGIEKVIEMSDGNNNDIGNYQSIYINNNGTQDSLIFLSRTDGTSAVNWADTVDVSANNTYLAAIAASEGTYSEFRINATQTDTINSDGGWYGTLDLGNILGAKRTADDQFFEGKITLVAIYDRKLTPAEITEVETAINTFFTIY